MLSKILGHSNIQTTCNLYLHFTEDLQMKAMNNVEDLIQDLYKAQ